MAQADEHQAAGIEHGITPLAYEVLNAVQEATGVYLTETQYSLAIDAMLKFPALTHPRGLRTLLGARTAQQIYNIIARDDFSVDDATEIRQCIEAALAHGRT